MSEKSGKVVWNAIWCSRHKMAPGQLDDLISHNVGEGSVSVIATMNITWCASRGASLDIAANIRQWRQLAANARIILGGLPPRGIGSLAGVPQAGGGQPLGVYSGIGTARH